MKIVKSYLKLSDGDIQEFNVHVSQTENDGVACVHFKGFTKRCLYADFGAGIDFEIPDAEKWMADYRYSEFWCRPAFGESFSDVPDETQALVYSKKDGNFGVVFPIVSDKYKCVLKGGDDGKLTARLFSLCSDLKSCDAPALVYAEGKNPYALLENCVKAALKLLGTGVRHRSERRYPEIFEYLGWCSWDAMEIRVNHDELVKKCEEFRDKNIPIKWCIIDDMWAHITDFYDMDYATRDDMFKLMHHSKLYSYKADPYRFPKGLEGCVKDINSYGIKVGMWHPTTGYWAGIDPDGEAYAELKDYLIKTVNGTYIHDCDKLKAYGYYSTIHDWFRKCGVDFVKIDNQSMSNAYYREIKPIGEAARGFHEGMEASVGQHFDGAVINCMGMASEDMWNRSVSAVSRCSNDFQPENKEWFISHITQCAYNSMIQGQFHYCDWDMWWSDDGQAIKNSVLRAISGGPIYVSDKLERSRREVLAPLALDDGRILRCDNPAVPCIDCITEDPTQSGNPFKLMNTANGSGIMAVFNLDSQNRSVVGKLSPSDIDGLEGEEFAVYEHFSGELKILSREESFELELKNIDEFKLYVVCPITDGFAAIGRIDKFISPATVKAVRGKEIELVENGSYAYVENGKLFIVK